MNEEQPLRLPIAHLMFPGDISRFAEMRWHCEDRAGCREPVVIHSLRYYRNRGRVLGAEHFWCQEHGAAFAARYHIEVEPAPDVSGMSSS